MLARRGYPFGWMLPHQVTHLTVLSIFFFGGKPLTTSWLDGAAPSHFGRDALLAAQPQHPWQPRKGV